MNTRKSPLHAGITLFASPTKTQQALALHQQGRFHEAERLLRTLLDSDRKNFDALHLMGLMHLQKKSFALGLDYLDRAIALRPNHAPLFNNHGIALRGLDRLEEALCSYERALAIKQNYPEAHNNKGNALLALHRDEEALASYELAIRLDSSNAQFLRNRGSALNALGRYEEASVAFSRSLELNPNDPHAYEGRGEALENLCKLEEALTDYTQALGINAVLPGPRMKRANILGDLKRYEEAISDYRIALTQLPGDTAVLLNLGTTLMEAGMPVDSEECFLSILRQAPEHPEALNNLGMLALKQGDLDSADRYFFSAMAAKQDFNIAHENWLFVHNYHPDKSAEEIYEAYAAYEQHFGAALRTQWPSHANAPSQGRRLRIGYVSPDLRQHSVRHFLEPLLASHDRSRFEVFAYAELASEDATTARYRACCDHFILTRGMSDEALASRIRTDAIDILVDVAGHTAGNRLLVFARKPAPVSLSWLGYGYTTGLSAIDYLLTDEASAPAGSEHLFSETPWRLPCAYAYRPDAGMGEVSALPALTTGRVTFGTLTRAIRINHRTIRVWAQILKRVPGSVLVIDSKNFQHASMQDAMAERLAQHGIGLEQLQIGCHSPPWDTLRSMDIGLDCFPHNSGTTLFETLYMGVPFITLAGRPSVGRLGRSILTGLGRDDWLRQWCADSEEDYIDKAVALASDLQALQHIRTDLRPTMQRSALMDEAGFARSVEQAYGQMLDQWQSSHRHRETESARHPSEMTN